MKPFIRYTLWLVGLLLVVVMVGYGCRSGQSDSTAQKTEQSPQQTTPQKHHRHRHHHHRSDSTENQTAQPSTTNAAAATVPQKVLTVLAYIRQHGQAPDGYVGGRTFGNFENHLPKTDASGKPIRYQEWDVNPKVSGQNRGTQRLITGSDGRAYYTADHYNTFTEIK